MTVLDLFYHRSTPKQALSRNKPAIQASTPRCADKNGTLSACIRVIQIENGANIAADTPTSYQQNSLIVRGKTGNIAEVLPVRFPLNQISAEGRAI